MINENYVINYSKEKILIQILKQSNSYYIYIGNTNMFFNNLILSIPFQNNIDNNKNIVTKELIVDENEINNYGKIIGEFLSKKINKPIFISFNLNDELIKTNPFIIESLQENLFKLLN